MILQTIAPFNCTLKLKFILQQFQKSTPFYKINCRSQIPYMIFAKQNYWNFCFISVIFEDLLSPERFFLVFTVYSPKRFIVVTSMNVRFCDLAHFNQNYRSCKFQIITTKNLLISYSYHNYYYFQDLLKFHELF